VAITAYLSGAPGFTLGCGGVCVARLFYFSVLCLFLCFVFSSTCVFCIQWCVRFSLSRKTKRVYNKQVIYLVAKSMSLIVIKHLLAFISVVLLNKTLRLSFFLKIQRIYDTDMETVLFTRDVLFNLKCNHDDI
jgi:hypothetical protein